MGRSKCIKRISLLFLQVIDIVQSYTFCSIGLAVISNPIIFWWYFVLIVLCIDIRLEFQLYFHSSVY